jgi:phage shock protein C
MEKRLLRSRTDSMVGGVCGGLARYLGVDPTLVRLIFVLIALAPGPGLLVYLALWIVIPAEDRPAGTTVEQNIQANAEEIAQRARTFGSEVRTAAREPNPKATMIFGLALIGMGAIVLLQNLGLPWLWWVKGDILWPILLILVGLTLIWSRLKKGV